MFAAPRTSAAPHLDGQRFSGPGGIQPCAETAIGARIAAPAKTQSNCLKVVPMICSPGICRMASAASVLVLASMRPRLEAGNFAVERGESVNCLPERQGEEEF